jgi:tetratricopeptide (TPR) repeat protein
LLTGCASVSFSENRDEVFSAAVEASLSSDHELAAANANHYANTATVDDPRYDRALRILANSSEALGLSYAASLWYLDIAQARRDVEVVADAVRGIEQITYKYPYDMETILRGFLVGGEITGLPEERQAFIDYHQGLDSMIRGLEKWSSFHFDAIGQRSEFRARANYALGVKMLAEGDIEDAQEAFEDILVTKHLPKDLEIDTKRSLARIAFEQKRFEDALVMYNDIRQTAPDDPLLLLEMAWSHYYLGESRRALGLLIALDAPAYKELIAPERFLLEAMSLRRLCQFEPARSAARRLMGKHGTELDDLRRGVPLLDSEALRAAAGLRTAGREVSDFRRRLQLEREIVEDLSVGDKLEKTLLAMYDRGIEEIQRREDEVLENEMEKLAEELLSAEEGVRLILHEIGVGLLRGRRRIGVEERVALDFEPDKSPALYTFEGEFWTDELDDIVVTIEDRCID